MTDDAPYQPLRTGGKTVVMSMRIPVGLRDLMIEDLDAVGDYNNLNQWIQQAIREFLVKRRALRQSDDQQRGSVLPGFVPGGDSIEATRNPPAVDGMSAS